MTDEPFWTRKSLDEMSDAEWESLCDGCGRCCLHKLEDTDTGQVCFTRVACELLDTDSCRCTDYANRFDRVPDCLSVRPLDEQKLGWLPGSCAYKRLSEGKPLENWHPLVSGCADSTRLAGISMSQLCISETYVPADDMFEHIIHWHD